MHSLTREDGKEIPTSILLRGTATGYCYELALVLLMIETTGLAHCGVSIETASDRYLDRLCWLLWYRCCGDAAANPVCGIGRLGVPHLGPCFAATPHV